MGLRRAAVAAGILTFILLAPPAGAARRSDARVARIGAADAAQPVQLVLPLVADEAGLERFARAVSTPGSPQYAQYESIPQLAERFGASAATRRRVVRYLRSAGARDVSVDATGLFANATLSVGRAERVFATPLARFSAARGVRFIAPTASARVPAALKGLIRGVVGLDTRPVFAAPGQLRTARRTRAVARAAQASSAYTPASGTPSGCGRAAGTGGFTPNQYLTAYDYASLRAGGVAGQGERVALIEIDGYISSDIANFAHCFGLPVPHINNFGVGVKTQLPPGGESTLDIEILDAAAPALKAIDVYESSANAADTLRALSAPLQNPGFRPQVISASLGLCERDTVAAVGQSGIDATQGALAMAAASGITFLAASGDSGSADCVDASGAPLNELAVNYPASSSWATGVGGTNLVLNAANQIALQPVWDDTTVQPGSAGGGGLSRLFARPGYQLGTVGPNARAVPDVSMLSDILPGYAIYCSVSGDCINATNSDPWQTVGGTSAATPLLAGGLALVDQELRMNDRRSLGLVNPLLYGIGHTAARTSVFNDVTVGSNDVGPEIINDGGSLGCCAAGPGYDEASGWGSVDLAKLAALAVQVQPKIGNVRLSLPGHQNPVRRRHILATVWCSENCSMGAYAEVRIGRSKAFKVVTRVFHLRSMGHKTIRLRFSPRQLRRLRGALSRHERIRAMVFGAIVDPAGDIEKRTRGKMLKIRS